MPVRAAPAAQNSAGADENGTPEELSNPSYTSESENSPCPPPLKTLLFLEGT